jgi:hypothetical protein
MVDERTIDLNKLKAFDMALGEEQSVKGIPGGRFGVEAVEDMCDVYAQDLQAARSQVHRNFRERHFDLQFPEPALYCNFPKTGAACNGAHITSREMPLDVWELLLEIPPEDGEHDMRIQKQAHH